MFELWPSDGYVNRKRSNIPYGYVIDGTETYVSSNGSRVGTCRTDPSMGKCFEIAD